MKRIIGCCLALFLLFTACWALAEELPGGSCGEGLTWELEDGVLTISGTGAMNAYSVTDLGNDLYLTTAPWAQYADGITGLCIETGVNALGNYAFFGLNRLAAIDFVGAPESIGICTFSMCPSLTSVELPSGMTTVNQGAFLCDEGLESVALPASIELLDTISFSECPNLTTVTYAGTVEQAALVQCEDDTLYLLPWTCLGGDVFVREFGGTFDGFTWHYQGGTLTVEGSGYLNFDSSSDVPWYDIRGVIRAAVFSGDITDLGNYCLYYCSSLTNVTIPGSVTYITSSFATGTNNIESVNFVGTTAQAAQIDCQSIALKLVPWVCTDDTYYLPVGGDVGDGFTWSIQDRALTLSGTGDFYLSSVWSAPWSDYKDSITSIEITEGITSLRGGGFNHFGGMRSLYLPASLTSIAVDVFRSAYFLRDVYYAGNAEQAQAIDCQDVDLLQLVWQCSDGTYKADIGGAIDENLSWAFEDTVLTITGTGALECDLSDAPWAAFVNDIYFIVIEDGVTSVGDNVFYDIQLHDGVTIPASVTEIGSHAYYPGHYLHEVTYMGTVEQAAAVVCHDNTLNTLPWSCTNGTYTPTLGGTFGENDAFSWEIADGTLRIDGTGELPTFAYNSDAPWYDFSSAIDEIVIGNGITALNNNVFCGSIDSLTFPSTLEYIYEYSFDLYGDMPEIYFEGAMEQADAVVCEDNDLNRILWHCTNGDLWRTIRGTHGDNLTWAFCNGTLTISGQGAMASASYYYYPWHAYYEEIHSVVIGEGVETLSGECFSGYYNMTSVQLPSTLSSIGNYAFHNCTDLTDVTYGGTVEAAANVACDDITLSLLPWTCTNGIYTREIGGECGGNITWTLADGVLTLTGTGPMYTYGNFDIPWEGYRNMIRSAVVEYGITELSQYCFDSCYTMESVEIADSVTTLGFECFDNCDALTSVTGMNGVTSMGNYCFSHCYALTEFTLPLHVTGIPSYCFLGCQSLQSVVIPTGVTYIGYGAFYNCRNLTTITLPPTVTDFTYYAFNYCTSLERVIFTGTVEQAEALNLSNTPLHGLTWQCTDETVQPLGARGSLNDEITWTLRNGVLTVTGTGDMPFSNPWSNYRNEIQTAVFSEGITSLSYNCLYNCVNLTSVTLPQNSLRALDNGCFENCKSLESLTLPDTITTINPYCFYGCEALQSISLPSGLTVLKYNTFDNCKALQSIVIPDGVTDIGENCFNGCEALTEITLPDSIETIWGNAFTGCTALTAVHFDGNKEDAKAIDCRDALISDITWYCLDGELYGLPIGGAFGENHTWAIENGVLTISGTGAMPNTSVPWESFKNTVTALVVEEGVTNVTNWLFYNYPAMTSITLAPSVSTIGEYAFNYCRLLDTVTLQTETVLIGDVETVRGVQTLGADCFAGCSTLAGIDLPESLTTIGNWAFSNCSALTSLEIPASVTSMGVGCLQASGLTRFDFPASMNSVPESFFRSCASLTSVSLPDDITFIGASAFQDCPLLEDIDLPERLTGIGEKAFCGCAALKSVSIPAGVTSLPYEAFFNCTSLENITFDGETLTSIGQSCFDNCTSLTSVAIPEGLTALNYYVFYNCSSLTDVELPATLTTIYSACFHNCSSLTQIRFAGTRKQALNITCNDSDALNLRWVCSDGTLNNLIDPPDDYCGENLTWALTDGVLTISGTGAMYDFDTDVKEHYAPWYLRRDEITKVVIEGGTSVGKKAFLECDSLTEVTIADSVTMLDDDCFNDCDNLTSVTLSSNLESIGARSFYDCWELEEIDLPDGLKALGDACFKSCSEFASLTLPGSLEIIGDECFSGCNGLKNVVIEEGITMLSDGCFANCFRSSDDPVRITLPQTMEVLGEKCFYYCEYLTGITFPEGFKSIGNECFYSCTSLTAVEFPEGLTDLGRSAFRNCDGLTTLTLPGGVESIGNNCFNDCDGLTTVTVESGIEALPDYCFSDCNALKTVTVSGSVATIGENCFRNCDHLRTVNLSEGTENFGYNAFNGCAALLEIDLPLSAYAFDSYAFSGCVNLTTVNFPGLPAHKATMQFNNGNEALIDAQWNFIDPTELKLPAAMKVISEGAFEGTEAQRIVLPDGVTEIQSGAFADCENLLEIVFNGDPQSIAADALDGCRNTVITVPADAANASSWANDRLTDGAKFRKYVTD